MSYGNWWDSVNTKFDSQNSSFPSTSSLYHGVSGHHICVWRFHASLYLHISMTLKTTPPKTRFQNGTLPHQITHLPLIQSNHHFLLSSPVSLSEPIPYLKIPFGGFTLIINPVLRALYIATLILFPITYHLSYFLPIIFNFSVG